MCKDTRDLGLTPWSGRSLGVRNGHPLQYSCLRNPLDRGVLRAIVHRVAKSGTQLSDWGYHKHIQRVNFINPTGHKTNLLTKTVDSKWQTSFKSKFIDSGSQVFSVLLHLSPIYFQQFPLTDHFSSLIIMQFLQM